MWQLLILASRNLFRNARRTGLTMAAISVGLAMMIATINFQYGSYKELTTNAISQLAGHVVVQHPRWQDERESQYLVTDADTVATKLRATFPKAIVTQRVQVGGLLRSSSNSVGAGLAGYEPDQEAQISDLDDKLIDGEWLGSDDLRGIIIGTGMADSLDVKLNDKLVFMSQQKGEEMASRLFRVRGIFRTGSADLDGFVAVSHIDAARDLLGGKAVAHQVAVHLPDARTSEADARTAANALQRDDLFVGSWLDAIPEIYALIQVDRTSSDLMMAVIGFIVALGVLNTVLMSVLERTREFGTMMAVGMRRTSIAGLVLIEATVLGFFGSALGCVLGIGISYPLVNSGIDMSGYMGETMVTGGVAVSTLIMGAWDPNRMALYACLAVVFTILAAIPPAWRVTRMKPVDAMRHS